MNVSVEYLLQVIGALAVENRMLREQLTALQALEETPRTQDD